MKIAVVQIASNSQDIKGNLDKHREFIKKAKSENVDFLLFPELSLTGYHVGPYLLDNSLWADSSILKELAALSGDMRTIVGFAREGRGAQFYNAAAILCNGRVDFIHNKINLPHHGGLEEKKYFTDGSCLENYHYSRDWNASLLICADLWNPMLPNLAVLKKATIMFAPIASTLEAVGEGFSNPDGWKLNLRYLSMIYGLPIVMSNLVGKVEGFQFWGGSMIVNPYGEIVAQNDSGEEGMIVESLDYDDVRRARKRLPTLRDSNLSFLNREIKRIYND